MKRIENDEMFWELTDEELESALKNQSCKICIRYPNKNDVACTSCLAGSKDMFVMAEIKEGDNING